MGTRFALLGHTGSSMMRCFAPLFALGILAGGCNDPEPVQAFRTTVFIGERGISIPLPPPSLAAEPQQEVEVQGIVDGDVEPGSEVRLVDTAGGDETVAEIEEDSFAATLELDLSAGCIEAWLVASDGSQGEHRFFSTVISDDDTVEVREGCE